MSYAFLFFKSLYIRRPIYAFIVHTSPIYLILGEEEGWNQQLSARPQSFERKLGGQTDVLDICIV